MSGIWAFYGTVFPLLLDIRYRACGTGSFLALTACCFITYLYKGWLIFLLQSGFSIYCDDAGGKENQPAKPVPGKFAPTLAARPASVLVMRPSPAFEVRPAPALPPALPRLPIIEKENTLPALMLKVTWRFPFSRYGIYEPRWQSTVPFRTYLELKDF
jgi:hypothetical protein